MDHCLSYTAPSSLKPSSPLCFLGNSPAPSSFSSVRRNRRSAGASVHAATTGVGRAAVVAASSAAGHCEYGSSLNTPHEPRSWPGRVLGGVLQNQRQFFHPAAAELLAQLAVDRDGAVDRMKNSAGSPEYCLHRRIAIMKDNECRNAVEDVMYMLIIYQFSEIRVSLVPRLSKCIYNGRLEIWPPKDWELESIYSFEVLEMIREHITAVIGLSAKASVTDTWATTHIRQLHLAEVYAASIMYGYFLKAAYTRHQLEMSIACTHKGILPPRQAAFSLAELLPHGLRSLVLGHVDNTQSVSLCQGCCVQGKDDESLRSYVMGFDPETLRRCERLRSKEASDLIDKHCSGLFGDKKKDSFETDEVISTSFSSLKRLVLEAAAFGSFLWETEDYVNTLFKLED